MLLAGWLRLCAALCSLLLGQAEAPNPGVPPERSRPYAVLRGQNLGEQSGAGPSGMRVCSQSKEHPGLGAGGAGAVPEVWCSQSQFSCCQPKLGSQLSCPVCWRHLLKLEAGDLGLCLHVRLYGFKLGSRVNLHPSLFLPNRPVLSDGVCNGRFSSPYTPGAALRPYMYLGSFIVS